MAVHISEIHPNPESGFEWVEIHNDTQEFLHANQIRLYDPTGKSLKLTVTDISPDSYVIATASAVLNNGGDAVFLEKDGVILESIAFGPIEQSKSYVRCGTMWLENVLPTYGRANLCAEPTEFVDNTVDTNSDNDETNMPEITFSPSKSPENSIMEKKKELGAKKFMYFNQKHALSEVKTSLTPSTPVTQIPLSPPLQKASSLSPLVLVGFFSVIQLIFLVYLIFRRIRYR